MMKKLKILFLAGWYPNKKNPTEGIFIKEHAIAASLFNDVIVVYGELDKSNQHNITDKIEDNVRTIRFRYKYLINSTISFFFYLQSIKKIVKQLTETSQWKPDVIHAQPFIAGVPAFFLKKIYHIPVAISEHSSDFLQHKLNWFLTIIAKFVLKRADIILPVSNTLLSSIRSYGIHTKSEIVPNVVDTSKFFLSSKLNDKPLKRVLCVAWLTEVKGIEYLLEAVAQIKNKRQDFIVDIVGNGPKKEEFIKYTNDNNIQDLINFHQQENKEKIAERMKNCDFFILPSQYETFSVACIEAMACGKPVIASNIPALKEKINSERGIIFQSRNSTKLSENIDYMLDNFHKYSAEKISNYVNENFTYESVGKQLTKIYTNLLN